MNPETLELLKQAAKTATAQGIQYNDFLQLARAAFLDEAVASANGNQCRAARRFNVHRNTIHRVVQERRMA